MRNPSGRFRWKVFRATHSQFSFFCLFVSLVSVRVCVCACTSVAKNELSPLPDASPPRCRHTKQSVHGQ